MLRASRDEALTDALTGLGNRRALTRELDARCRTRVSRGAARARAVRPRRLQALQRHLRPPGRRRAARPPGRQPARPSSAAAAAPSGWAATSSARCFEPAPTSADAARRTAPRGALRARRGLLDRLLLRLDRAARRGRRPPPRRCGIADQRMYAQKHAGRMSAGRQSKDVLLRALAERNPDLGGHLPRSPSSPRRTARRLGLGRRRGRAGPPRGRAARRRQGRRSPTRSSPSPARSTRTSGRFVRRHPLIGERIVGAAPALSRVADARALQPRALGRRRLPGPPGRRGDPARLAHRRRRRRLRRDDRRAPLPRRAHAAGGARRAARAAPARSSTRRVVEAFASPARPRARRRRA